MPLPRQSLSTATAVDRSIILNREGSDKVSSAIATMFNECGRTTVWPASHFSIDITVTQVRYFADALWAGLVPPFSNFFNAVILHYQMQALHLDPGSIILLPAFAFLCNALVGIAPSVDLFRLFISLRLVNGRQCSGCMSFQAVMTTAGFGIDFTLRTDARGF